MVTSWSWHSGRARSVARLVGAAAAVALAALAAPALGGPSAGAAASPPTPASISPTFGPVGTVVHARGDVGSACAAQAAQGAGTATPTLFLQFQQGPGPGQANEWINVPVAPDGVWSASFVIPAFVGGQAMTQGSLGADVTPGTWQFGLPVCTASSALVDFDVTPSTPVPTAFVAMAATPDGHGYWLAQAGGGVFAYGDATYEGSLPAYRLSPPTPVSAIAPTPDGHGYWLVDQGGDVFAFGDAGFYGSLASAGVRPLGVVVDLTPTHDAKGYWLAGADGGVFTFGDAPYLGNAQDGVPRVALLASPDAKGYVLPSATGIVAVAQGDGVATSRTPWALSTLLDGAALTPDGKGIWEVGTDGGVFGDGDAAFYGSLPSRGLTSAAPVVAMARSADGHGYWLLGADGGVFSFGDAPYLGSAAGLGLPW